VSDQGSRRPDGGEVREWVGYLKDIGVRELRLSAADGGGATPRAAAPAKKSAPGPAEQPAQSSPSEIDGFDDPPPADPGERLEEIRRDLGECTRCKLHEQRTHVVFGVGNPRARLMFIGEGPGAEEDARGEPFVGRAGKKLDEMISAIGLERAEVYIANIVKCRPPKNRDPERDEIETCSPFLERQIEAIRPKVIVTLGAPAARTMLATRIGITKLRGQWQAFRGIPVMPTYHPAYLLRVYTKENRRKVFDDLKAARARMDE
jgi:uracil-DNA glycosylase family 4